MAHAIPDTNTHISIMHSWSINISARWRVCILEEYADLGGKVNALSSKRRSKIAFGAVR